MFEYFECVFVLYFFVFFFLYQITVQISAATSNTTPDVCCIIPLLFIYYHLTTSHWSPRNRRSLLFDRDRLRLERGAQRSPSDSLSSELLLPPCEGGAV